MKVSVCMITYNHERFVAQAIESALRQQTDFDYELVIGEDNSSDRTRQIVEAYQRRHPDKIRLLLSERNIGMAPNFIRSLQACRGQYIALLEGDDYWTAPEKLQKQVDLLDRHPECAICFHRTRWVIEGRADQGWHYPNWNYPTLSTIRDLLQRNPMNTCSVVFKSGAEKCLPDWFAGVGVADYPLHILNALRGGIYYLDEVLADYRVHEGGVWSTKSRSNNSSRMVAVLERIRPLLAGKDLAIIDSQINTAKLWLSLYAGDTRKARLYAFKQLVTASTVRSKLKSLAVLGSPKMYRSLRMRGEE